MNSYIAGPITGIDNDNIEAFKKLQDRLFLERDIVATTPHEVCDGKGCVGYNDYMAECVRFLLREDTTKVFMLNGWQNSKGARSEHELAVIYGKEIYYEGGF
jgi:hypothetical protein